MSGVLLVPLLDGRTLEAVEEGDGRGALLIFHHGSPGAAVPFEPFDRAAAERGIRMVTLSRPGFGGSTRSPGRSVADAAAD
ncbi:MAG: alpha/beta hydrolase, partial [Actinomycetota bacterium]